MKRRISENYPKNPSSIRRRSSPIRGFNEVRSSISRFEQTISCENEDSCGEKMKCANPETDHHRNSRHVTFGVPVPDDVTEVPKSDGAKTSEFAFFKKLKKDAGQSSHPYTLHKKGEQLEKSESSEYTGDMTNMVRRSFKNLKSSCLVEKATAINLDSFPSPLADQSNSSEMTNMNRHNLKNVPVNIDSFPSPFGGPAKSSVSETKGLHEGVFSVKRQRLHRWVADISSPGNDELASKGNDLVSILLTRLLPACYENNPCRESEDLKLRQREIDTKCERPVFPDSDADLKKLPGTATGKLMEPEHMSYMDNGSLAYWSNNSRKVALSRWDTPGWDPPASNANKTHLQYEREFDLDLDGGTTANVCDDTDSSWDTIGWDSPASHADSGHLQYKKKFNIDLDGGTTASVCTETDSAFGFSFNSLASNQRKELDEICVPNEPVFGRQPHKLLLGWNFDDMKDEQGLSFASQNTEPSLCPSLSTSSSDSDWHDSESMSDASGLCMPSFLSSYSLNFTSPLHFRSASYCNLDFEGHVLKEKKDIHAALNHFPLALSFTPNNHDLTEDFRYETTCKSSSIFPSPQDHYQFMRNISSNRYFPALEALLFTSGDNYGIENKFLSITDSFSKHHSSNLHALEFPQEEGKHLYFSTKDDYGNYFYGSNYGETSLNHITKDELNIHDWPSLSFQLSLDKEKKAFPLLLDKSSWDGSDGDTYSDDTDIKHIQCFSHISESDTTFML